MRVILSRKGFESTHEGIPSPILPDGTLLLLPKPDNDGYVSYKEFYCEGTSYYDIAVSLDSKMQDVLKDARCNSSCYIAKSDHRPPLKWFPAYLRTGPLESHLNRQRVSVGDLFLFYGCFRQTEYDANHHLRFVPNAPEQNIIFSYFQIGAIIKNLSFISSHFQWPLHTLIDKDTSIQHTIYLPTKKLSYNNQQPGFDILSYSQKLVLTKPGLHYYQWQLPDFLCAPDVKISYHNNRNNGFLSGKDYFKSSSIGEEFVIHGTYDLQRWVHSLIYMSDVAITEDEDVSRLRDIAHFNYVDQDSKVYCRKGNTIVDANSLDCSGCTAYCQNSKHNCVECHWKDYVSIKEGNLSIVNPYEEMKRVNWLLNRRLLPEEIVIH